MNIFTRKSKEVEKELQETKSLVESLTKQVEELTNLNKDLTEKLSESFDKEQDLKEEIVQAEKELEEIKELVEETSKELETVITEDLPKVEESVTNKVVEILSEVGHPPVELSSVEKIDEKAKDLKEQFMAIQDQTQRLEFFRKHKNELFRLV